MITNTTPVINGSSTATTVASCASMLNMTVKPTTKVITLRKVCSTPMPIMSVIARTSEVMRVMMSPVCSLR